MHLSLVLRSLVVVNIFKVVISDIENPFEDENNLFEKTHDTNNDDYSYDHNAILGGDSYKYDKLTAEESKKKFSEIIDKMDINHNGMVEFQELRDWIQNVINKMFTDNIDSQWQKYNPAQMDKINFDYYVNQAFGEKNSPDHLNLIKIENRRWTVADQDNDSMLNKTEFHRFVHPEHFKDMRLVIAEETLEGMDKNNDSVVDIDEYLKDMFPQGKEIKEEWVRNERQNFGIDRDLNKDGVMDRDEIHNWLFPESYNRAEAETQHLMDLADVDGNNILSKSEMLDKYKVFVGSANVDGFEGQYPNHDDL